MNQNSEKQIASPLELMAFKNCARGDLERLKENLCKLNPVDIRDREGNSLLHIAVKFGHNDIVKYLNSTCYFYLFLTNDLKLGVLDYAVLYHPKDFFDELAQNLEEADELYLQLKEMYLILASYPKQEKLFIAISHGYVTLFHYLMLLDPKSIYKKNDLGETSITLAIRYDQPEILNYIFEKIISMNILSPKARYTIFHSAMEYFSYRVIRYFMENDFLSIPKVEAILKKNSIIENQNDVATNFSERFFTMQSSVSYTNDLIEQLKQKETTVNNRSHK